MVAILLGNGFEEMEALCPCDCLRRVGLEVRLVSVDGSKIVMGAHGIDVAADCDLREIEDEPIEMIMLPGGLGGVNAIMANRDAMALIRQTYDAGQYVAAICAAPTVLAALHITDDKKATCYPGMEDRMGTAQMCMDQSVVQDGRVITSTAAGTAMEFALHLVQPLRGADAAAELKQSLVYRCR